MKGCGEHHKPSTSVDPAPIDAWRAQALKLGESNPSEALYYATLEFLFPSYGYCGHALNVGLSN